MYPRESTIRRTAAALRSATYHLVADGSSVAGALLEARTRREAKQARIAAFGYPSPTGLRPAARRWVGTQLVRLGERLRGLPAVAPAAEAAAQ